MSQLVNEMCIIFSVCSFFSSEKYISKSFLALTKHLKETHFTPFIIMLKYTKVYPMWAQYIQLLMLLLKIQEQQVIVQILFFVCCRLTKDKEFEKVGLFFAYSHIATHFTNFFDDEFFLTLGIVDRQQADAYPKCKLKNLGFI